MQKNLNIEKIIFKVVQMKFLAMHITNQKLSFDTFTVQNIFMEHDILMIFGIKENLIILTHTMYCCLLLQIYLCYWWLLLCSRVINHGCFKYCWLTGPKLVLLIVLTSISKCAKMHFFINYSKMWKEKLNWYEQNLMIVFSSRIWEDPKSIWSFNGRKMSV